MLCAICEAFDARKLFALAAARARETQPKVPGRGFPEYQGFPEFYKHYIGLNALYASATEGCTLCASIWQQFSRTLPSNLNEQQMETARGEFGEQIFLGLSNWSPEAQGMPYLTAKQRTARGATRDLATFDVFRERGIEHGSEPLRPEDLLSRAVQPSPTSETSLSIAADWLTNCMTAHRICSRGSRQDKCLPTRVIDVGSDSPRQSPRLVIPNGTRGSWAALSYCWGGDSTFVLKSTNLKEFRNGQTDIGNFPATLRDAIVVTRRLKLRFLWIDALCIMQDSAEDWAIEAARMKEVYGGATVTISAANSHSTTAGIFHERSIPATSCEIAWNQGEPSEIDSVFLRSASHFWDTRMKGNPLNKRGWTLQESLLSPRTLSYGSQQMAWECQEQRVDESGRPILPGEEYRDKRFLQSMVAGKPSLRERGMRNMTTFSLKTMPLGWTMVPHSWDAKYHQLYSRWSAITKEFTSRNLTVYSDVLPALSGLARGFQDLLDDQYCAGLWKKDIIRGLTWVRPAPQDAVSGPSALQVDESCRVPSWSWASIKGGMLFNTLELGWPYLGLEETAKVDEISTTPRFKDPLGQTSGGYLMIRAPFCPITDPRSEDQGSKRTNPVLETHIRMQQSDYSWRAEFGQQHQHHPGQHFAVLRIVRYSRELHSVIQKGKINMPGTCLMIVETTGQQLDEYRRIGLLTIAVPFLADPDDINQQLFTEMESIRWKWKKLRLI
ncbi:MAG: hypothetical protein Q9217_006263 [Psora testacea]